MYSPFLRYDRVTPTDLELRHVPTEVTILAESAARFKESVENQEISNNDSAYYQFVV